MNKTGGQEKEPLGSVFFDWENNTDPIIFFIDQWPMLLLLTTGEEGLVDYINWLIEIEELRIFNPDREYLAS